MDSKPKKLKGRVVFITGNSRSIGKAIALRVAQDGALVVLASDSDLSDLVNEVNNAGGRGFYVKMDVKSEDSVHAAVQKAVDRFGGIDILVNNTNMITNTDTEETSLKDFDEVHAMNVRATFIVTKACLPHLKTGRDPHVLNIAPPINLHRRWFAGRVSYTMAKFGMSMCILAMAQEFKGFGIMVNCLWPRFVIENEDEAKSMSKDVCRKPDIMGDAAHSIFVKDPKPTGLFYFDDHALKEDGITETDNYCVNPKMVRQLYLQTFVDESGILYPVADMKKMTLKIEKSEIGTRFEELIAKIESLLDEKMISKVNALYHITVKGAESKESTLDLRIGKGTFRTGIPSDKPDIHMTMDDGIFFDIFVKGFKPMFAFANNQLMAEGDQNKIRLLDEIIRVCKSKI